MLPSRLEGYKAQKAEPPLPVISAKYIYDWLMEVGPTENGGMGPVQLSWKEICAWSSMTFTSMTAWEARLLRELSSEFITESRQAEDRNRPPPWTPVAAAVDREAEERRLREVLG